MRRLIFLLLVFVMLCGCESNENLVEKNTLSAVDILETMNENEYIVIDVRTKDEYNTGHIVNAINIPYDEISENIEISKDKVLFVYCRSGKRSNIAYNTLKELGYEVYDLGSYDSLNLDKE